MTALATPAGLTLADAVERFLARPDLSPHTIRVYRQVLAPLLEDLGPDTATGPLEGRASVVTDRRLLRAGGRRCSRELVNALMGELGVLRDRTEADAGLVSVADRLLEPVARDVELLPSVANRFAVVRHAAAST